MESKYKRVWVVKDQGQIVSKPEVSKSMARFHMALLESSGRTLRMEQVWMWV